MASELTPMTQQDLSGGENTVASPFNLAPNQVQQAINVILDEHGAMRTRDGTLIQGVQSPKPTQKIVKIYDLVNVSGATTNLAIIQGSTCNLLYNRSANPWTFYGVLSSSYGTPDMVTFIDEAVIANGNADQIRVFSGSNLAVPTSTPTAAHVAVHLSYLWAWNTAATTNVSAGPSSLQAADINTVNSWPPASQTFIAKDDGQKGMGMGIFTIAETGISPTVTIVCFKDFSAYEVSGTFAANNLSVQKVKSDMGCVAPRTIQFISGFGIIRLSHRGFALYDGVNDTLISEEERPRIFGRDSYTGLDWSNISLSMASQVANPPLYVCACPVAGGTGILTRVFVYDLVRKAWTIQEFANALSTLQLPLDPGVLPTMYGGDATAGYVRRYFSGDTTDDGFPISSLIRTRAFTTGSPMERMYVRRFLLEVFKMNVNTLVTSTFYFGPNIMNVNKTLPTIMNTYPAQGYGQNPYGSAPYGDPVLAASANATLVFDILGGALTNDIYADVSWSGPGKIRGLGFHVRKKPLTRTTTSVLQ